MEDNQNNPVKPNDESNSFLTAHQLVMRHIENPDVPITDNDIRNIVLGDEKLKGKETTASEEPIPLSDEEKKEADDLADELGKNNTGMSYQADI